MEIEATSADRNLLLEMKGELDHHGARNALRELELSIDYYQNVLSSFL